MNSKKFSEAMGEIGDKYLNEAISYQKKRKSQSWVKWASMAACFALIIMSVVLWQQGQNTPPITPGTDDPTPPITNPPIDGDTHEQDLEPFDLEIMFELNDKIYSLVDTKESPAYENYNLEENITTDMLGEYQTEITIQVDNDGNKDTFKVYRYINAPLTEYDWFPRMIAESSAGIYYHALIGSNFNADKQTADEILNVYGLSSADSIISIENETGTKITDKEFIQNFYNGLFTKEYGGNDFLQENVYQNTGIDESEIGDFYSKHADDMIYLKVELSNGLVIGVNFTSHNYVEVDHSLYFKVDDSWLDLVSVYQ